MPHPARLEDAVTDHKKHRGGIRQRALDPHDAVSKNSHHVRCKQRRRPRNLKAIAMTLGQGRQHGASRGQAEASEGTAILASTGPAQQVPMRETHAEH